MTTKTYIPAIVITGKDSRGNEYAYWKSSESNQPEVKSMGKWDEWFDGYNEIFTSRRCYETMILPIITTVRFGELEMTRSEWVAAGCPLRLTRAEIEQYATAESDADKLHELIVICDTDPAHILNAQMEVDWRTEAEAQAADAADWRATRESDYPQ